MLHTVFSKTHVKLCYKLCYDSCYLAVPPRPPASAASVKQRAGVYNYVKGDGSCPYYAVLACLRRLEHASIEGEKIPTAKDLHSVDSVLRHSVE